MIFGTSNFRIQPCTVSRISTRNSYIDPRHEEYYLNSEMGLLSKYLWAVGNKLNYPTPDINDAKNGKKILSPITSLKEKYLFYKYFFSAFLLRCFRQKKNSSFLSKRY
ncbi:unnamed protein product [Rhizophagus irregularis]|nr:unnamed protein product [Rhizophagus irregularis]